VAESYIIAIISALLGGAVVFGVQLCIEKRRFIQNKKKITTLIKSDIKVIEVLVQSISESGLNSVPKSLIEEILSKQTTWSELKVQAIEYLDLKDIESLTNLFWVIETSVISLYKKGVVTLDDKKIKLIVQSIDELNESFNKQQ